METLDALALVSRFVVGAIFVLSGATKIAAPRFARSLTSYGVPARATMPVAVGIAASELALGGLALIGSFLPVVAALCVLVLLVFSVVPSWTTSPTGGCGCFGELLPETSRGGQLIRNAILILLAAVMAVWPADVVLRDAEEGVAVALIVSGFVGVLLLLSYIHFIWSPGRTSSDASSVQ